MLHLFSKVFYKKRDTGAISNATRIEGIKMIKPITTGSIPVQQKLIKSWNFRRGSVARNHTKIKQKIHVFNASTILCTLINVSFTTTWGKWYPPMNKIAVKADISTILQYSAKKNITKGIPLCSVKKPATNSDSASGRSNGVRFVSASTEIKNTMNKGNSGIKNHTPCWLSMIDV